MYYNIYMHVMYISYSMSNRVVWVGEIEKWFRIQGRGRVHLYHMLADLNKTFCLVANHQLSCFF